MQLLSRIQAMAGQAWWALRQITGDAAYEIYAGNSHSEDALNARDMSREQFYLDSLRRRYSQVNRCC